MNKRLLFSVVLMLPFGAFAEPKIHFDFSAIQGFDQETNPQDTESMHRITWEQSVADSKSRQTYQVELLDALDKAKSATLKKEILSELRLISDPSVGLVLQKYFTDADIGEYSMDIAVESGADVSETLTRIYPTANESIRIAIAKIFGDLVYTQAADIILPDLDGMDKSLELRATVASALAKMGNQAVLAPLRKRILRPDSDIMAYEQAVLLYVETVASQKSDAYKFAQDIFVASKFPENSCYALNVLKSTAPQQTLVSDIKKALCHPDSTVQKTALDIAIQMPSPELRKLIEQRLGEVSNKIIYLSALAEINALDSLPAFPPLFRSTDDATAYEAMSAFIGVANDYSAEKLLSNIHATDNPNALKQILLQVPRLNPEQAIILAKDKGNPDSLRTSVLEVLQVKQLPDSWHALYAIASDKNDSLNATADRLIRSMDVSFRQAGLSDSLQALSGNQEKVLWMNLLVTCPRQIAIKIIQQKYGNITAYKNTFAAIKDELDESTRMTANSLLPATDGSIDLFNKSLEGWRISQDPDKTWAWEGDELICKQFAFLNSVTEYSDFRLSFEFKLVSGSNNGIGFRQKPDYFTEVQILDNTAPEHQNLKAFQYSGSLYGITAASTREQKPLGEWNTMSVELKGRKIKVIGNDATILVNTNMDEAVSEIKKEHYDAGYEYAYKAIQSPAGEIVFLGHSGPPVRFRNIRIINYDPPKTLNHYNQP